MATDGTQFLIDMVAKLTGGTASVATLADLGDRLLAAGATANDLERAVKATSVALEDSTSAMKANGAAVSEGEAAYRQAEASADRAAKAVERIGAAAEAQRGKLKAAIDAGNAGSVETATAKLRELVTREEEAKSKALGAAAALNVEAASLDKLKASAAASAAKHADMIKGLANVKGAAEQAAKAEKAAAGSGKVNEMAEALGKLGGPAGVAGQKLLGVASGFSKLRASVGAAGFYVATAVAIVAIASAAIFATVAVGRWAVGLADANRSWSLLAAGVARSTSGGEQLEATISKLGTVVPQTNEELLAMAGGLADTGLRGKALASALEVAAVSAAKLKWGPDFAKQMLSLDVQSRRLHNNLADTFGVLNIEKLLGGVQTLVALFDASTASGRALKFLFEALFQPLIDGVSDAIPSIERFFLHAEILALKAYIALKPYREEIKMVGEAFLVAAAVIVGVLVVALGALVAAIGLVAFSILAPIAAVYMFFASLGEVWAEMKAVFADAVAFVSDLGSQMMQGLVNGITGGAAAVVGAITGAVGGAIDAAKHMLGIASPSKVFEGIGGFTAEGFAAGVDGGAGGAQGSLEALVAPPDARGGAPGGGARGPVTVNITVDGRGESDEGLAAKIAAAVRDVFESDALSIGGGEVPA